MLPSHTVLLITYLRQLGPTATTKDGHPSSGALNTRRLRDTLDIMVGTEGKPRSISPLRFHQLCLTFLILIR